LSGDCKNWDNSSSDGLTKERKTSILAASFFLRLRTAAVQNPSGRRKNGLKRAKNAAKGGGGGCSL